MNISLTPELEKFIESKVQSGFYSSASEVVREGLRLLSDKESKNQSEWLNYEIQKGEEDLRMGRYLDEKQARNYFSKKIEMLNSQNENN